MSGEGLCECGCGQKTRLETITSAKRGWVKGQPRRFVKGHVRRTPFWSHVQKGADDECWPWTASCRHGYGQTTWQGRREYTHRVAWEIANGRPPGKGFVMHSCDNPPCCNPAHLSLGDQKANMGDCALRGRSAHGERQGRAKLTSDQVEEIRARVESGERQRSLAREFEVSPATICYIVKGKTWTHVA